jgi:hypothetical protein
LEEKFRKNLDLHESEWRHEGKSEPIWGHGAAYFFQVVVPTAVVTAICGYIIKFIVYGLFP